MLSSHVKNQIVSYIQAHEEFPSTVISVLFDRSLSHTNKQIENILRNRAIIEACIEHVERLKEHFFCVFRIVCQNNVGGATKRFNHDIGVVGIAQHRNQIDVSHFVAPPSFTLRSLPRPQEKACKLRGRASCSHSACRRQ